MDSFGLKIALSKIKYPWEIHISMGQWVAMPEKLQFSGESVLILRQITAKGYCFCKNHQSNAWECK